jgi:predicted small lipoprotein YifL
MNQRIVTFAFLKIIHFMKRNFLTLALSALFLLSVTSCGSKSNSTDLPAGVVTNPNTADGNFDKDALPVISFEKDFHDFGKLISGEQVTYSFKFKNTGKSLLIISNVSTSCGCTVSSFPKQPIKPGEGSTIDVSFDSEGRHGLQTKSITVFTNTQPPTTTLRIQSQVVEPDNL